MRIKASEAKAGMLINVCETLCEIEEVKLPSDPTDPNSFVTFLVSYPYTGDFEFALASVQIQVNAIIGMFNDNPKE